MKRITVSFAPLAFEALARHLSGEATAEEHLREAIRTVVEVRRRLDAQAEKRRGTSSLWDRLFGRSVGVCECGCGRPFGEGLESFPTLDHWHGRARAPENEWTCWMLRWGCHDDKENSRPSRAAWQRKWSAHKKRLGVVNGLKVQQP